MKLRPIVPLMSLIFAATLTGCNLDGSSSDSDSSSSSDSGSANGSSSVQSEATSPLAGGYWNISGEDDATAVRTLTRSVDLPNVHVFSGSTHYYYNDDDTPGEYAVTTHDFEDNIEDAKIAFNHYDSSGQPTLVNGSYEVSGDALSIVTDNYGTLSGVNKASDESIKTAIEVINEKENIIIVTGGESFDTYTSGTNISEANNVWKEYNTTADSEAGLSSKAIVSSDFANSGDNSLLINDLDTTNKPFVAREFAGGATNSGSVSFNVYIPSSNEKTTYINVGAGKNNSDRYFELRLSGSGKVEAETGSTDTKIGEIETDTWNAISLAWDNGSITVTINSEEHSMNQSDTGLGSENTPSQLTLYTGDTDGNANKAYFDDIKSDLF